MSPQEQSIAARLPHDILAELFEWFTLDSENSPWDLTQISSAWRAAAFAIPTLWSGIHIRSYNPVPRFRHAEGKEICITNSQLRAALDRAGNAPLDIQITYISALSDELAILSAALELLRESTRRWRSLITRGLSGQSFSIIEKWFQSNHHLKEEGGLKELEHLALPLSSPSILQSVQRSAKKLREFVGLVDSLPYLPTRPSLKSLGIRGSSWGLTPQKRSELVQQFLDGAVSLEDIGLQVISTSEINWKRLKSPITSLHLLEFDKDGTIPYQSCLTHLVIRHNTQPAIIPKVISLPTLTRLEISGRAPEEIYKSCVCPSLVSLSFRDCFWDRLNGPEDTLPDL